MSKHRRLLAAAALAALAVILLVVWQGQVNPRDTDTPARVAQTEPPKLDAIVARVVQQSQHAEPSAQPFRLGTKPDGAVRFLGVAPGWRLPAGGSLVANDPAATALRFLQAHRTTFGVENPRIDLSLFRIQENPGFTSVRVQQSYGSLPVLAAETVVQVTESGDIQCVLADLATNLDVLDALPLPLTPAIGVEEAPEHAELLVSALLGHGPLQASESRLVVYVPDVLGLPGEPTLAWEVAVQTPAGVVRDRGRAIVHAENGELLNYLDKMHAATDRVVYDDNNSTAADPALTSDRVGAARIEGGAATGVAQVDNLYDFIAQTDAYYLANHQRNGYDNAGARIYAIARYAPAAGPSPWPQASAGGNVMQFGDGYVTDDIVAHEYTHLVTEQTSRLIYQNASGAINESLSDIWGEFMDLSNNGATPNGNDAASVRWELGEDRPAGPIRSMRDPADLLRAPAAPRFSDPDRLGSTNYVAHARLPDGTNDNGGVHSNSGVNNKLVYLLTDGDTFNGQTITAEGIANVATLFYQVQTNFLVPASDWRDLYFAITQAAANLEWSAPRQININKACSAVEISGAGHDYYVDRASPTLTAEAPPRPIQQVGIPNVVGDLGPYRSIPAGIAAVNTGGTLNLNGAAGNYNANSGAGPVTLVKPMTLKSYNAPTTIVP